MSTPIQLELIVVVGFLWAARAGIEGSKVAGGLMLGILSKCKMQNEKRLEG